MHLIFRIMSRCVHLVEKEYAKAATICDAIFYSHCNVLSILMQYISSKTLNYHKETKHRNVEQDET